MATLNMSDFYKILCRKKYMQFASNCIAEPIFLLVQIVLTE